MTIYYENELEDEFSTAEIHAKKIDGNYSYEGGFTRKAGRVFFYHLLAKPLAKLFLKIKFGHQIKNKSVLKVIKGQGYYLYGNHTNEIADALIPTIVQFWGSVYVIVHPNNVSMPVLGKITPSLGALPLPDTMEAMKNFRTAIRHKIAEGKCVTIYPEAHIWPYYTKIRPYKNTSFGYPVQDQAPVFCFTNTYQKRRMRKTPRITTYVDGPFYPVKSLPVSQQKEMLRKQVYETMVQRSQNNNVEIIHYVKKESAQ